MRSVPIPFLERFVGVPVGPQPTAPIGNWVGAPVYLSDTAEERDSARPTTTPSLPPANPERLMTEVWSRRMVDSYYRASTMERFARETPWFPVETPSSQAIRLFYAALSTYPEGSVAHSIGRVETLREDTSFSEVLRGCSFSKEPDRAVKCFSFIYNDMELRELTDIVGFWRNKVHDIVQQLEIEWRKSGIPYWDIPIRR